jgi:hypothetical protein
LSGGIIANSFDGFVCAKAGDRALITVHATTIANTVPTNDRMIAIPNSATLFFMPSSGIFAEAGTNQLDDRLLLLKRHRAEGYQLSVPNVPLPSVARENGSI